MSSGPDAGDPASYRQVIPAGRPVRDDRDVPRDMSAFDWGHESDPFVPGPPPNQRLRVFGAVIVSLVVVGGVVVLALVTPPTHNPFTGSVSPQERQAIEAEVNPTDPDCRELSGWAILLGNASMLQVDPSSAVALSELNRDATNLLATVRARVPADPSVPALRTLVADSGAPEPGVGQVLADVAAVSATSTFNGCDNLNELYSSVVTPPSNVVSRTAPH